VFRFKSILSRILFLHAAAVVITAICMPVALYWFLSSDVRNLQQRALQAQTESLARYLTVRPDGGWSLKLPEGLQEQYSEAYGRYSYVVLDEAERVLFSSRKDTGAIFPIDAHATDIAFPEVHLEDRTLTGASVRKRVGDRFVWIQVAEDLAHRDVLVDDVVANLFRNVGWITLPILLLLLATDIVIFRRAVQPLLRASDRAAHISPTRTDVRLPTDDIPSEIRPLVVAVNQALDRLEQGFRRLREFTADAAHELRTPLSVLRMRIDTLPDRPTADALRGNVEGMSRVVSQLLDAAELEMLVVIPHEKADLRAVCAEVAEFIAPLALAQGKTLALSGAEGSVWVQGNAEMLRRAVRNLVENALNHTAKGTDVEILVGEQGTVSVLDQGEGIPAVNRERIFERFWRRDRRRPGGAGLGLSIVKRIVEAHGASIAVANRPNGGADFTIRFIADAAPTPQEGKAEAQSTLAATS
jgi:signal transduction histidine kinase